MPKVSKILIIPPHPWYMEAQAEYLIRYLSDEFFIELASIPYPPYNTYLERFPNESPFMRNPDEYDLIWPIWPGHWGVPQEYRSKIATVFYEPNEGPQDVAVVGCTTPMAHVSIEKPHHELKFGVDTNIFKPYSMVREDNLLHVGMVGTLYNARRMVIDLIPVLKKIPGIRIMLFLNMAPRDQKELNDVGGDLNIIVGGDKKWPGLPNIYNQLDVLIRCDQDQGYSFPVLEAAACKVPIIATNSGIDHIITEAGGGILIPGIRADHMNHPEVTVEKVKEAVIWMRDNPKKRKQMGVDAWYEIKMNWELEDQIPAWREFFREGVKNAHTTEKLD